MILILQKGDNVNITGASKEECAKTGAFKMMNLATDAAIFGFCGMKVISHTHYSSVPSVTQNDRKKMLGELRQLAREKL